MTDPRPSPAPGRTALQELMWRAGGLADAVRLVAGESGEWQPQGKQKRQEWDEAVDAMLALDAALTVIRALSPLPAAGLSEESAKVLLQFCETGRINAASHEDWIAAITFLRLASAPSQEGEQG